MCNTPAGLPCHCHTWHRQPVKTTLAHFVVNNKYATTTYIFKIKAPKTTYLGEKKHTTTPFRQSSFTILTEFKPLASWVNSGDPPFHLIVPVHRLSSFLYYDCPLPLSLKSPAGAAPANKHVLSCEANHDSHMLSSILDRWVFLHTLA